MADTLTGSWRPTADHRACSAMPGPVFLNCRAEPRFDDLMLDAFFQVDTLLHLTVLTPARRSHGFTRT